MSNNLFFSPEVILNDNKLSGPIPRVITRIQKLKQLYLHRNRFSGSIPKELRLLNKLSKWNN